MHGRIRKFLPRYVLVVLIGCLVLACRFSGLEEKSRVENRKPVPEFSIPESVPGRNYVYFIAIGDQGMGDGNQKHVARLMNEKARKDSLHFVLALGDNFYGKGVTSVNDVQWKSKFEEMYDLSHLRVPFYATLGNHDHSNGNGRHQVEYSKRSDKWKMPHFYYTFSKKIDAHSSIQFFVLDTYVIVQSGEYAIEQVEWLDRELRASTATWKIVYGHHPVFSYGKHGNEVRMIDLVRPLLEKYAVDAYLCGHDHDRQLLEPVGGVYYIVSGTGSKSRDTRYGETTIFAETNLGFAWFRVSAGEFHVQFINAYGEVEYAHTWTKGSVPKRHYEAFDKVGRFVAKEND
jgi:acid phosphatase